jgi:vacuolar-type H+-ATPase subunit C/Vma6
VSAADLALVARAKGLATHLLSRATLERLASADGLVSFARDLRHLGADLDPIDETADVTAIDRAVGRTAARHLHTLARWPHRRPGALDLFAADQERRALRALLRGAVQGAPAAQRLAGLLPTPRLPLRALTELARQPSAAGVVRQLVLLGHPDAPGLLPLVRQAQPDLLPIEIALLRAFAGRATAAARGDRHVRAYVHERIDLGNAQNALLIAGGPRDVTPGDCFVDGGRWLPREPFVSAASAVSVERALATLHRALAGSPLAAALPVLAGETGRLERQYLAGAFQRLHEAARREPLSAAPLLWVLLRLEAQSRDLRALAWGALLGAPPTLRRQELVTP